MKKIVKSALIIACLLVMSRVLGLLREIFLAQQFGTSYIVDAYTVACTLPTILFAVFASGFSNSYLPVYVRIQDKRRQNIFFNNLLFALVILSIVIMVACMHLSPVISRVLAPGFDENTTKLTTSFLRIIVIYLPFYTAFNIFAAHANANEDFVASNFCDYVVVNVIVIISIMAASPERPMVLIYGFVLSMVVATVLLGLRIYTKRFASFAFVINLKDRDFLQLCSLAIPTGITMLTNQINAAVDKMFSSSLGEGITSALSYANKVQLIPYSLITSIFITVCMPRMNRCFAEGDHKGGLSYSKRSLKIALIIAIPVIASIFAFSEPIIKLLFERGAFDREATKITAACLIGYAIGMPFYAFRDIVAKTLSANLKQKLVLKNTIFAVIINILLNFIMVDWMGYRGLAFATSFSGFFASCLMGADLRRLGLSVLERSLLYDAGKSICASVVSVGSAYILYSVLIDHLGNMITTIVALLFVIVAYFSFCVVMNVQILEWLYSNLPNRLKIIRKWN